MIAVAQVIARNAELSKYRNDDAVNSLERRRQRLGLRLGLRWWWRRRLGFGFGFGFGFGGQSHGGR
jgi:hypothetical protein